MFSPTGTSFNSFFQRMKIIFCLLISCASSWNNLNCPAPRSPDNGLSFIFRSGELIHFRCHPGYLLSGQAVAHCVNNQWTHPAPECLPIIKNAHHPNSIAQPEFYSRKNQANYGRQLFNWDDVYGDGPRRLPLINGIWPSQNEAQQIWSLGMQSRPKTMIKDEIGIAELRHTQLEELKKQRYINRQLRGKRKKGQNKRRKNSGETVLALGSTEEGPAFSVALAKPRKIHKKKDYSSRRSRVETNGPKELRRRPVEEIQLTSDASCVEYVFGRTLPKLSPPVKSAFVHRYETKRNNSYPFNEYMSVKYKCLTGYHFANPLSQTLFCKDGTWIGETPRCIENSRRSLSFE